MIFTYITTFNNIFGNFGGSHYKIWCNYEEYVFSNCRRDLQWSLFCHVRGQQSQRRKLDFKKNFYLKIDTEKAISHLLVQSPKSRDSARLMPGGRQCRGPDKLNRHLLRARKGNSAKLELEAELGLEPRYSSIGCGQPKQHLNHCVKCTGKLLFFHFWSLVSLSF